ncbi:STAS domain-containing protein [Streptomyces sp. NPDC005385]|uniref:STAS domain-containing protein n=1 Tax=Streptomyces sp. NPDC005385 TaxID=3157039 RepID=UPI0033A742E4
MSPLNIIHDDTATGPSLRVIGELDFDQAAGLRQRVEQLPLLPGQCLVIDLSGLEYCDSTGITALLAARHHAHTAHADIVLAAVPANLMRVLTLVGLDRVFTIGPGDGV